MVLKITFLKPQKPNEGKPQHLFKAVSFKHIWEKLFSMKYGVWGYLKDQGNNAMEILSYLLTLMSF